MPNAVKGYWLCTKNDREFLLVEGIQQTEFETLMLQDTNAGNNAMRQKWLANIICYKLGWKDYYIKDCHYSASTSSGSEQSMSV